MAEELKMNGKFEITRRDFVKAGAAATAGAGLLGWPQDWRVVGPNPAVADQVVRKVRNLCVYCSIGCGAWVALDAQDNVVDVYGDQESVTNRGRLCSKGRCLVQLVNSKERIGIPGQTDHYLYGDSAVMTGGPMKKVGNGNWQSIGWGTAIEEIADRLKDVKDTSPDGANSVVFYGSSHYTNEENYLYKKMLTLFGTNNTEHQARI